MSKRIFWIFAAAVTALALSLNAVAQPGGGGPRGQGGMGPGGGMGMMGGGMMGGFGGGIGGVVQNPEFAKMLELTPQQTTELQQVMREAGEAIRTQMQTIPRPEPGDGDGPPSPEVMRQNMEKVRQIMEKGIDEAQAKIDQVLQPVQRTKLRETSFQLMGGLESPMLNDRLLAAVDLTDAQKEQVRKLVEERNAEIANAMMARDWRSGPPAPEERERLQTANEERNKKFADQIKAVLTPEQKAKAETLTAEAPALREKLGIPAPGPRGPQGSGQRQGGGGQAAPYVPGSGAWQPGQGSSDAPPPATAPAGQRRGGFPRGENN